jgi:hypothetical protein
MDDDGFGSDVDVYVDEEHDEEDAELLSRRSSRGALAAKAEQFLRRHSANLPEADTPRATDADLFPDAGGDTNMDAETVVETVVELKRVPSRQEETREQRSRRRDADSVLRDKARLQRFANEAASFLDKAYDNDATLIVDDDVDAETGAKRAPPGGAGSSDDFKKKRYIELDKARLERFSREAEAFIDRAYSDDPSTFIEEEMLSPSSSSLKINSARAAQCLTHSAFKVYRHRRQAYARAVSHAGNVVPERRSSCRYPPSQFPNSAHHHAQVFIRSVFGCY